MKFTGAWHKRLYKLSELIAELLRQMGYAFCSPSRKLIG